MLCMPLEIGFPMCSLVNAYSLLTLRLKNTNTHYLLFYYSFTNMSMNSFITVIPPGRPEMAYLIGPYLAAVTMWYYSIEYLSLQ
jgi:hypothetical protein